MSDPCDRSLQRMRCAVFVGICGALLNAAAGLGQDVHPIVAPAIISEPGSYVLMRVSRSVRGEMPAVIIRGRDITLDLNGQTLSGPETKMGVGISVENASSVAVRNGIVTGFQIGVQVLSSNNVRIEGVQIQGRDLGGAPPDVEIGVLLVNSRGVVVRDNTVSRTFLGVFVRGGGSGGNRIAGNTLTGDQNGMLGICYNPAMGEGIAAPKGDFVYSNLISRFATGIALSTDTKSNIFRDNAIAYRQQAVADMSGGANILDGNLAAQLP